MILAQAAKTWTAAKSDALIPTLLSPGTEQNSPRNGNVPDR